jgi:hypothetical protein
VSDRAYYKVYDGRKRVGYTSPTVDMPGVWSVYNGDAKKIAMVAPMEDVFNVMFYGRKTEATDDWIACKSFKLAVARIFKLQGLPRFEPPLPRIELGAVPGSESAAQALAATPTPAPAPAEAAPNVYRAKASALIRKVLRSCHADDARRSTLDAFAKEAKRRYDGGAGRPPADPFGKTAAAILDKVLASTEEAARAPTLEALVKEARSLRARY